jgi:hypothetical protein
MTVKLYFETLTEGMHAKLNSRYVARKPVHVYSTSTSLLRTDPQKAARTRFLEDDVIRMRSKMH